MNRHITLLVIIMCLTMCTASFADDVRLPWHFGMESYTLDNGLRVLLKQNTNPSGQLEILFIVKAGSLHDEKDKAGTAHFVEHMAFNGTTHFKPGELNNAYDFMNAHTNHAYTAYIIETPCHNMDNVKKAVTIIADFMHGIQFLPEEVENERNVILSEIDAMKIRGELGYGSDRDAATAVSKEMAINDDWYSVIGDAVSVKAITRDDLVAYYRRWYTPGRMGIIMVGDLPVAEMKTIIDEIIRPEDFPAANVDVQDPIIPDRRDMMIHAIHDDDYPYAKQFKILIRLKPQRVESESDIETAIADWLILDAIKRRSRRSESKTSDAHNPFGLNVTPLFTLLDTKLLVLALPSDVLRDTPEENQAKTLFREIESLRRHGILAAEVRRSVTQLLKHMDREANNADSVHSSELAYQIAGKFISGITFTTDALEILRKHLEAVDTDTVNSRIREIFAYEKLSIVAHTDEEKEEASEKEQIEALYKEVLEEEIPPPLQPEETAPDLDAANLPPPTEITEYRFLEPIGATRITLANGITLFLKKTDFQKGRVFLRSFNPVNPHLYESWQNAGITDLAEEMWKMGGTKGYSEDEIKSVSEERDFAIEPGLVFNGFGDTDDLEDIFRLVYLYMTEPEFNEEDMEPARIRTRTDYNDRPSDILKRQFLNLTCYGNYRSVYLDLSQLKSLSRDAIVEWWNKMFYSGELQFALVGDFDTEKAVALASKYLGALPSPNEISQSEIFDACGFPDGYTRREFGYTFSDAPPWTHIFFSGQYDFIIDPYMEIAVTILDMRIKRRIREELGQSYIANAAIFEIEDMMNMHCMEIYFNTSEEDRDTTLKEVYTVIKTFAENGPTDEELAEAVEILTRKSQENLSDNAFWLRLLSSGHVTPTLMKRALRMDREYQQMTTKKVQRAVADYISEDRPKIEIILK